MASDVLKTCNLKTYYFTKRRIVRAVDDVDLRIEKGEAVGLVGESGCGKSTLGLSIMGLLPRIAKREGEIWFASKNLIELAEGDMRKIRGDKISMVFQDPMTYLNPVMKIGDQISEALRLNPDEKAADVKHRIIQMLTRLGMASAERVIGYYPHQLSGGMRQRVLIATAIISNPNLVILDEPTTALDATIQMQILDIIKKMKEEYDLSMLLITHDLGIVAEICDTVYVMYAGNIVEHGEIFTMFENPKHPYTQGLLESILSIHEFKEVIPTICGDPPDLVDCPSGCRFHPRCTKKKEICSKKEPEKTMLEQKHVVYCHLYS